MALSVAAIVGIVFACIVVIVGVAVVVYVVVSNKERATQEQALKDAHRSKGEPNVKDSPKAVETNDAVVVVETGGGVIDAGVVIDTGGAIDAGVDEVDDEVDDEVESEQVEVDDEVESEQVEVCMIDTDCSKIGNVCFNGKCVCGPGYTSV